MRMYSSQCWALRWGNNLFNSLTNSRIVLNCWCRISGRGKDAALSTHKWNIGILDLHQKTGRMCGCETCETLVQVIGPISGNRKRAIEELDSMNCRTSLQKNFSSTQKSYRERRRIWKLMYWNALHRPFLHHLRKQIQILQANKNRVWFLPFVPQPGSPHPLQDYGKHVRYKNGNDVRSTRYRMQEFPDERGKQ